jgi:hypothetical protein
MQFMSNIFTKKVSLVFTVILFVVLGLYLLYGKVTVAHITIITNNADNVVSVTRTSGVGSSKRIVQQQGDIKINLKAGQYTINVANKVFETSQTITVKARETKSYTLNLDVAAAVEPVLSEGAIAVSASSDHLYYVDEQSGSLYKLGADGLPVLLSNTVAFKSLKWAGESFAVGLGSDGKLYVVNADTVTLLNVPFTYNGQSINYSVAGNGDVYVSSGRDIYSLFGSTVKKVYVAQSSRPSLVAGKQSLAVLDQHPKDSPSPIKGGENGSSESYVTLVDAKGKTISKALEGYEFAWSPDGNQFAVSSDEISKVYNKDLRATSVIPSSNPNSLAWLDNNTLLYGVGESLWSFNTNSSKATLIANMPLGGAVSGIYPSADDNYVYLAVASSDGGSYTLARIGLKNQAVTDKALQLGANLPKELNECYLGYINFIKTRLVLKADPVFKEGCRIQTQQELQNDGLDSQGYAQIEENYSVL